MIRKSFGFLSIRSFSVIARPPPRYNEHVPLTIPERVILGAGSAVLSFFDPRRADLIAACGEATATPYFICRLRDVMLSDETGRRILKDRPRITSTSLDLDRLRRLPENTVGREYIGWLEREGVSPDTRAAVRYIDDPECAYVMQRYRECHDFYHALTGLPTIREGEVALKAFEFANTLIPMTGLSMFAAFTLKPDASRRIWQTYFPWAIRNGLQAKDIINIYWEEELETDVDKLREIIRLEKPLDLRQTRAELRAKKVAEKLARVTMDVRK